MGTEIERKFLVTGETWRTGTGGEFCRQGYLAFGPPVAVRIRIAGDRAILNIKKATLDIARAEFEYPVPVEDAECMLSSLRVGGLVEKTRYRITYGDHVWEVDEFHGENAGLVVAEIELRHVEERFARPPWTGDEVSGDARYLNTCLAQTPYTQWPRED